MKLDDVFTFGKHKGKNLKTVMENYGSYVGWCVENVKGFDIEPPELKSKFMAGYQKWKWRIEHQNYSPFTKGSETALREDWEESDTCPWGGFN